MMAFFLVFSINSFSQDKPHKTVQSGKIVQPKKGNAKTGKKPRKSVSKKKVHKPAPKKSSKKSSGNGVKL